MMHKPVVNALLPLVVKAGPRQLALVSIMGLWIAAALPVLAAVQDPEIEQLNQLVAANHYEDAYGKPPISYTPDSFIKYCSSNFAGGMPSLLPCLRTGL